MEPLYYALFFHFIGLGLIFTALLGGWILNGQYKRCTAWKDKQLILKPLRSVGLLSPLSMIVMLLSGLGNMHALGLGPLSETWLTVKLVLFLIVVASGLVAGIRGRRRGELVALMAEGKAPEGTEPAIRALDRQQIAFLYVNGALILVIVFLSIAKPW